MTNSLGSLRTIENIILFMLLIFVNINGYYDIVNVKNNK